MCKVIESNYILIHQLKDRSSCSINDLVHKKEIIERNIPSVYIDVSKNSILNTVSNYPEIFSWVDNKITRKEDSNEYFLEPLINYFDINISEPIKEQITSILALDE